MYGGKGLCWLITFSIFACAGHAARPSGVAAMQKQILETLSRQKPTCQDFGAEKQKKKWYHWYQHCHCQVEQYPSKGCGQVDESKETQTFRLSAAHPETCRCISASEKSVEASGRKCQDIKHTVWEASDHRLPHFDTLRQQRCYCVRLDYFPSKGCGEFDEVTGLEYSIDSREYQRGDRSERLFRSFRLATAEPSCECLTSIGKSLERSKVVKAAAVRFCALVVEKTAVKVGLGRSVEIQRDFVQKDLGVNRELCREVLTGTLKNFSASQESKDLFGEVNALSEHRDTKGFGHLDPLFAPQSSKKYQQMLQHVCRDECKEIVDETLEKIDDMAFHDVRKKATPSEETCADNVVRKVEAEILGCCGRACGWDEISKTCTSWPFFTKDEKVNWLEECCGEFNILQNSTREVMCDSVLSPQQAKLLRKLDTKAANGTDVGGAYLGQDPPLVWTTKGLGQSKFQSQLKKLKTEPKEGDYITAEFLERHPKIRREGLQAGWFKEKKDIEDKKGATSLAQADKSCTAAKLHYIHHCPGDVKIQTLNNCLREEVWEVSDLPEEECNEKMIYEGKVEPRETPDDCLDVDFGDVKIRRRFFRYDTSKPPKGQPVLDKPILCSFEPMEHESSCEDEFDRHTLNKDRFEGFAGNIHWISEEKVEIRKKKKSEDAGRVQKTLADMKSS